MNTSIEISAPEAICPVECMAIAKIKVDMQKAIVYETLSAAHALVLAFACGELFSALNILYKNLYPNWVLVRKGTLSANRAITPGNITSTGHISGRDILIERVATNIKQPTKYPIKCKKVR